MGKYISVVFALNANQNTGAGHWMRCIQLANEFVGAGHMVDFYGKVDIKWLAQVHCNSSMGRKYNPHFKYDLLIVDSYSQKFISQAVSRIRHGKSIQVLDSASPINQFDGAIWADPNPVPSKLLQRTRLIEKGPILLTPTSSPVFNPHPNPNEILITLGGNPSDELVRMVLEQISAPQFDKFSFNLFSNTSKFMSPKNNLKKFPLSLELDSIAARSGTVITNAGTSLWKFIALKKAIGMIKVAGNQQANYEYALKNGLALPIADYVESCEFDTSALLSLVLDKATRDNMNFCQSKFLANQESSLLISKIVNFTVT